MFDIIAFDADDTLWHMEYLFSAALEEIKTLLAPYRDGHVEDFVTLTHATEMRNLPYYGFGIKGFILSALETAIPYTQGRLAGAEMARFLDIAKSMATAPVKLADGAEATVARLAEAYPLMLITKGDLLDQESKLRRSGLQPYFRRVEIVSDKTEASYAALLQKHGLTPARFLMVGNSLRSDILPVVALGGQAIYIPHILTWTHERVEPPAEARGKYHELERLRDLPAFLDALRSATPQRAEFSAGG